MVYSDEGAYSLWMCIGSEDRQKAIEFFKEQSTQNANNTGSSQALNERDLFNDNMILPIETLMKAPFTIHLIEQREGDFVLTPPQCAYQMINKVKKHLEN
jgi:hypothetical protein